MVQCVCSCNPIKLLYLLRAASHSSHMLTTPILGALQQLMSGGGTCPSPPTSPPPHTHTFIMCPAGPLSAGGNVSGNRCVSDCRSRGRKFDPGPVPYFRVEIDHEMISTVIHLPSADSFKKGCCQLQAKVCARITG